MDALNLEKIKPGQFDIAIDKGTFDALAVSVLAQLIVQF